MTISRIWTAWALASLWCAWSWAQTQGERAFVVDGKAELDLSNLSGSIKIGPAAADRQILVKYRKSDDAIEVVMSQRGNQVSVETQFPRRTNASGGVDYEISFPRDGRLSVQSVSGGIVAANLAGELSLKTVSGGVRADNLSGDLNLESVSGAIEMNGLGSARVAATSISGRVAYRGGALLGGEYDFASTSGRVIVVHGAGASYRISGRTISGSIVNRVGDALKVGKNPYSSVQTVSGSYKGGRVSVRVNTISGGILLTLEE